MTDMTHSRVLPVTHTHTHTRVAGVSRQPVISVIAAGLKPALRRARN